MKKYLIFGLLVAITFSMGGVLAAKPNFQLATVNPAGGHATVVIPEHAVQVAPGVFSLGTAIDPSGGKAVEGYAIVHYRPGYGKGNGKGPGNGKGGGGGDPAAGCYGFLARDAKWKVTEDYVVGAGIDPVAVARDFNTWDSQVVFEVFGDQDTTSVADGADTSSLDGMNEVMWGDVANQNAIAVAIVWGIFSGKPSWREIVEYDVVFDNVDYPNWGNAAVDPTVMDFENIATHEFGHAAGLADLYESTCSEQTMYGYADYGETKKRDLEVGDIAGIKELYK